MEEQHDDEDYRSAQARVRARLKFYRDAGTFVVVIAGLLVIDWLTGGDWWVHWVAGIWGSLLALDAFNTFIVPAFWGSETEARMIERDLHRRRGA